MGEHAPKLCAVDGIRAAILRHKGLNPVEIRLAHEAQQLGRIPTMDGGDTLQIPRVAKVELHSIPSGGAGLHVNVEYGERQRVIEAPSAR